MLPQDESPHIRVGYDPREVANFILDEASRLQKPITNLVLNKLIYFCHGWHLALLGTPLQRETFEAWQYGPVLRSVYSEFRESRTHPVQHKAKTLDLSTGQMVDIEPKIDIETATFLREILKSYIFLTPWQLVEITHVPNGPWDLALRRNSDSKRGARLNNSDIASFFATYRGKERQ